tara:strand:- start:366 stop:794 length:429 start_codon:yes stop_codon:yes gene_type:complete
MIKYRLVCKNCSLSFDSWFASSNEFEKLKRRNYLSCHKCNSKKVEKTLMAPKMIKVNNNLKIDKEKKELKVIKRKIVEYQNFIKKNFEYVGKNFAYEARSIHYDKKKKKKGIYGTASLKEINELKEEGIETNTIPWIKEKNN